MKAEKWCNVLSFDSSKVKIIYSDNGLPQRVEKITSLNEFDQIVSAEKYLIDNPFFVKQGKLKISPVTVLGWDNARSVVVTEYFSGVNLESLLRSHDLHGRKEVLALIKELFNGMREIGFLWGDCAPRNIIINEDVGYIKIVDFERKLILNKKSAEKGSFCRYIRNYSREEFSCFLSEDEQNYVFSDFMLPEDNMDIKVDDIGSGRKKKMLESLFGYKDSYDIGEVRHVEDLMVFVATPFYIDGKMFYPMDCLDEISFGFGQGKYVELVNKIKNLKNIERYEEIRVSEKIIK